eukprot:3367449-Pyramimonas_sp.AAC.1
MDIETSYDKALERHFGAGPSPPGPDEPCSPVGSEGSPPRLTKKTPPQDTPPSARGGVASLGESIGDVAKIQLESVYGCHGL